MKDKAAQLGTIALIGGGKMGEAIVVGLVKRAELDPAQVVVADPNEDRRAYLGATYGVPCVAEGAEVPHPRTVVLAVKPQVLREVCGPLVASPTFRPVRVISIAAGIDTATLRSLFGEAAVIRVMPNAPLMAGAGMSAVCVGPGTPRGEGELVRDLFSLMGEAVLLDEGLMNAATAVSGSGPAYFALFTEALARAARHRGLASADALLLATQTLKGAARYLELTGVAPGRLREAVTSPGGTTQAALEAFAAGGLFDLVDDAVAAADMRAKELA
ncbi:MAG: pyrroline-5-carboxylate reductase [Coriobacteriales bacterium]|jgi:pyrroline-5-carboxylate reductase|nr:pyrroline-5-carboxylate reductase [Coriobacteriales bacterium]